MTKEELINEIWDCYIDIHNSCGMISDEEAMQKSIKLLDEYEVSKLSQHDVIKNEVAVCPDCGCNRLQDDGGNYRTCLNILCDWKGQTVL